MGLSNLATIWVAMQDGQDCKFLRTLAMLVLLQLLISARCTVALHCYKNTSLSSIRPSLLS